MFYTDSSAIDRFILCCCRVVNLGVSSGHSTRPTGHLQLLPRKYLSDYCRPESIHCFGFPPCFPTPFFSTKLCSLVWFLSLVISISCALLATLLQQWARRYLKVTQPRYSPHKRARIRAFFAEGLDKFLLPLAVEALPTLLHVSLLLFFAGLVVFLCDVNLTIFKVVLSWVGVCTALYGCITFVPVFRHDSPYHTPLSLPAWHIVTGISWVILCVITFLTRFPCFSIEVYLRFGDLKKRYHKLLVRGMLKAAEETALNSPSEIDTRAFMWTFDSLDEDHELERFFSSLPGFRNSKVVDDPLPSLTTDQKLRLSMALIELLNLTFSSDLLPEHVKNRRAIICAKVIDSTEIRHAYWHIVDRILSEDQYRGLQTVEFGRIMRGWGDSGNQGAMLVVQAIHTGIVARAQLRDDSWFILASNELGIPESVLRDYTTHGDNLSLAILIHIIRQQFDYIQKGPWRGYTLSKILQAVSEFNVQDTSLDLQLKFCALWNQVVLKAQSENNKSIAWRILRHIRDVYVALHQDTNSSPTRFSPSTNDQAYILEEPSAYPLCRVPGHHPSSAPHIHEVSASITSPCAVMHDSAALFPDPFASSTDAPSFPVPAPVHVDEHLIYVPPLDNNISVSVTLQPADQTTIESHRIPATSPDSVTSRETQGGIDATARPMPFSTPELSASSRPSASTSPPSAVTVQHTAHRRTPSDIPNIPSSPSTAVFDNMLPTGPPLSPDSPVTRSDHESSSPGSHSSILASAAPGPSPPRLISALDLGAAAEGEGSTHVGSRKETDALDPSAIRKNIIAAPDLSPQSPSPPSVTGVAIAGPSRSSLDAEHTGDHPPHPLHGQ